MVVCLIPVFTDDENIPTLFDIPVIEGNEVALGQAGIAAEQEILQDALEMIRQGLLVVKLLELFQFFGVEILLGFRFWVNRRTIGTKPPLLELDLRMAILMVVDTNMTF